MYLHLYTNSPRTKTYLFKKDRNYTLINIHVYTLMPYSGISTEQKYHVSVFTYNNNNTTQYSGMDWNTECSNTLV